MSNYIWTGSNGFAWLTHVPNRQTDRYTDALRVTSVTIGRRPQLCNVCDAAYLLVHHLYWTLSSWTTNISIKLSMVLAKLYVAEKFVISINCGNIFTTLYRSARRCSCLLPLTATRWLQITTTTLVTTSMLVLGPKCTLAASHAAPDESHTVSMPMGQTDRQTNTRLSHNAFS